jgi:Ca-activated chloride channel family protein
MHRAAHRFVICAMAVPDPQREPHDTSELDAALRRVEVPDDLLSRLRSLAAGGASRADTTPQPEHDPAHAASAGEAAARSAPLGDVPSPRPPGLRQRLADVPLPAGLLPRLKQIAAPVHADAEPDEADDAIVPLVPPQARQRRTQRGAPGNATTHAVPSVPAAMAALADRSVEARLRDVAVPAGVLSRLRSAGPERRGGRWASAVAAASLAIVTLAIFAAAAGRLAGWGDAPAAIGPADRAGFIELSVVRPGDAPLDESIHQAVASSDQRAAAQRAAEPSLLLDPRQPVAELAGGWQRNDRGVSADRLLWRLDRTALLARPLGGVRGTIAELLTPPPRRSAAVPDDPAFDRRFYLQAGEWPVIRLERGAPPLRVSRVALGAEPFSLDLTRQALAAGHWPAARLLRKEEFLAGFELGGQRPASGILALRTAAGPAPWGEGRNLLLQVAVTAEGPRFAPRQPPVHLVVVVDVSPHMERSLHLEWVRRALHDAAAALRPEDRMSIVACGSQVSVVAQAATSQQAAALHAAIDALHGESAANPLGGLLAAYALAMSGLDAEAEAVRLGHIAQATQRRVVLLSDALHVDPPLNSGPWPWASAAPPGEVPAWLQGELASAAQRGVRLWAVDLGNQPSAPLWQRLLDAAAGTFSSVASSSALRGMVLEALAGRSQLLARDLQLTVTFDAQRVAAYRLIGYEPSTAPSAARETSSAEQTGALYCGQSAVVLYEVQLRPRPPAAEASATTARDELLAVAQLSWATPSGVQRQTAQRLTMSQVAPSFAESPGTLQLSALAAATAEILSGSLYMQGVSLGEVRATLRRLSGETAQQPACAELARLLDAALEAQGRTLRRGL